MQEFKTENSIFVSLNYFKMKKFLFLSVVSITLYSCGQNLKEVKGAKITNYVSSERSKYPTFERLIYELDSICDFDLDPNYMYDFAKKPDGYYLQIIGYNSKDKSYMNSGVLIESIKVWGVNNQRISLKKMPNKYKIYNSRSNYHFIKRH